MRREQAAQLAGVPVAQVAAVPVQAVRAALAGKVPTTVLEVATQEAATYWQARLGTDAVGARYYLDDPFFGPVVAIDDLVYDRELGLTVRPGAPTAD